MTERLNLTAAKSGEETLRELQGIVYYADWDLVQSNPALPNRPLKVVFLTSVRDVGISDRNGTIVETGNGVGYMEGAVEKTVKETHPSGKLADFVRVVGVITDDTPKDMQDSSYSALPDTSRDWIYPFNLLTPEGQLVQEMTYNIPSDFRLLPDRAEEERRQGKLEFEQRVFQKMRELGGDVIISDHYMARLDHLWSDFGIYGRVLNIHPAVTEDSSPYRFRGKTPTADAIEKAKSGVLTKTGATLHVIGKEIDAGPVLASVVGTPVFPTDEPQMLRYRNYIQAKLPLFINGLIHYARVIYPYLEVLNLSNLKPRTAQYSIQGGSLST